MGVNVDANVTARRLPNQKRGSFELLTDRNLLDISLIKLTKKVEEKQKQTKIKTPLIPITPKNWKTIDVKNYF